MVTFEMQVGGVRPAALGRFVNAARQAAGLKGDVNVVIAGDKRLRELNRRFRRTDRATDVLSFPAAIPSTRGNGAREKDGASIAGDIAISADIAAANAERLGHSLGAELKILVLHGVLHLAGYDHETDNGEMAALEQRLRKKLRLPASLTERT